MTRVSSTSNVSAPTASTRRSCSSGPHWRAKSSGSWWRRTRAVRPRSRSFNCCRPRRYAPTGCTASCSWSSSATCARGSCPAICPTQSPAASRSRTSRCTASVRTSPAATAWFPTTATWASSPTWRRRSKPSSGSRCASCRAATRRASNGWERPNTSAGSTTCVSERRSCSGATRCTARPSRDSARTRRRSSPR